MIQSTVDSPSKELGRATPASIYIVNFAQNLDN